MWSEHDIPAAGYYHEYYATGRLGPSELKRSRQSRKTSQVTMALCSCVALESRFGKAYNEEAFRYLLAIERKRAETSRGRRSCWFWCAQDQPDGDRRRFSPRRWQRDLSRRCGCCFREIDFTGWFRQRP